MISRSGFATTAALMLMAVVGAALLVLGSLLSTDAKRTLSEAEEAQLRQLIHAGAVDATVKVNSGTDVPTNWDLALPADIKGTVHVELDGQRVTITARHADRRMSETVQITSGR